MGGNAAKNVWQIVVLVVLLAVMGVMIFRMVRMISPPKQAPAAPSAAQAAPPQAGAPPAATPPAGGAAGQAGEQAQGTEQQTNTDLFRVYALQPPKNPFIQQEGWYTDVLARLPGYPELRDSNFFETMSSNLPSLRKYFGPDKSWASVELRKTYQPGTYTISGTSKDKRISTSITLEENSQPDIDLKWTPSTGIPLSATERPGWEREYKDLLSASPSGMTAQPGGGEVVPGEAPGLAIPGTGGPAAGQAGEGDQLVCAGVNLKNGKSSALMYYNGSPFLVYPGSVLPTHYQVMEIKEDGVVVLELRDGSSKWLPLQPYEAGKK